ncbi:MAG: hypothetical protein K2Q24_00745 [Chitinophagaceae bacterium]|jgi:hypothetical protein|nr:hypothetical protein [Chitinophagaceae bacterium]
MVITSRKLQDNLGINAEIADYFANERAIPQDNLFWRNKRVYISGGFGFLTIPLVYDLLCKLGVSEDILLEDDHVTLMEKGFDRFMRYENNEYSFDVFLQEMQALLNGKIKQQKLADDLFALVKGGSTTHFTFETTHKALARSDSFLFTILDLPLSDSWVEHFLPYWYAVARPILLLDDFKDLEDDRLKNEENTIIELGNDRHAIEAAYEMGLADIRIIETINPQLAKYMKNMLKESLLYDHIQKELGEAN